MPIYEYSCRDCGATSSLFVRVIDQLVEPNCGHCQGKEMVRMISAFAYHRSQDASPSDRGHADPPGMPPLDYYKDLRNIGRYLEGSFERSGVEMPEAVRETLDAAREGDLPKGLDL